MPTPLVHLYVSQQILEQFDGPAVALLRRRVGDFLLGSIAPDAWSLGEMTRREGHVLPIPPPRDVHGAAELLHQYPMLRDAGALRPAQAAFVAGYMTHLLLDEIWYHDLFDPYFLRGSSEPPVRQRLVLHNVLRLAVEDEWEPHVTPACIESLSALQIAYALPPIPDLVLRTWRDLIDAEFSPGGQKRSADVFAERMGVPVEELLAILKSPARMRDEVRSRLPAGLPERVVSDGVLLGSDLVGVYLNGREGDDMPLAIADQLRGGRHG